MIARYFRILTTLLFLTKYAVAGSMSYRITQNPNACHEVHLGTLSRPREIPYEGEASEVSTGYCHPEIRAAEESKLYLTAACQFDTQSKQSFPLSREKYSVDLSQSSSVRRIADKTWESAAVLQRTEGGYPNVPAGSGIEYKGLILQKSGPRWSGVGPGPIRASFSRNLAWAAVNSWDGFDITYNPLDPTSFGQRNKIQGQFWVDIYDTGSGGRAIQIQGSFDGAEPYTFQGQAAWYGDRYYVIPIGKTLGYGQFNLRRLLICDIEAAARPYDSTVLQKRK